MKKILTIILSVVLLLNLLASCSNKGKTLSTMEDPKTVVRILSEKDYSVEAVDNSERIEIFADEFKISPAGIYCIVFGEPNFECEDDDEKSGCIIYCESSDIAKNTKKLLSGYITENPVYL